ncbi:hypothetical protein ACIPF8_12305 [Collimonas sp. NPDC087041]|uniref:hypothetical protein n=1 Tax=Collimonas sp. NPDC087041 TaxID=3363960 RepID=UPI00380295E7
MKFINLLMGVFFCGALHASPMEYMTAKGLADRHEKMLSNAQIQALTSTQGVVGGKAIAECSVTMSSPESGQFSLVMQIDNNGTIVRTWLSGDSDVAKCFEKKMTGQKLFVPPFSPFYTVFEMHFR